MHFTSLHPIVLRCSAMYFTVLRCTVLYSSAHPVCLPLSLSMSLSYHSAYDSITHIVTVSLSIRSPDCISLSYILLSIALPQSAYPFYKQTLVAPSSSLYSAPQHNTGQDRTAYRNTKQQQHSNNTAYQSFVLIAHLGTASSLNPPVSVWGFATRLSCPAVWQEPSTQVPCRPVG